MWGSWTGNAASQKETFWESLTLYVKSWGTSAPSLDMQRWAYVEGMLHKEVPACGWGLKALHRSGLSPCTPLWQQLCSGCFGPDLWDLPIPGWVLPTWCRFVCKPYLSLEVDCIFQSLDPKPWKSEEDIKEKGRENKNIRFLYVCLSEKKN